MRIGKGWAPEPIKDDASSFAICELRTLLEKLFTFPRTRLRAGKYK